jgi:tape measure domain-containing protein
MAEAERRPERTGARRRPSRSDPAATARRLYADLFSAEERSALASALARDDLEQEVALLRVLIRRAAAEGVSLETLSRAMGRLAQMLRVQHVLRGQAARSLDEALARVLEEIGNELGL